MFKKLFYSSVLTVCLLSAAGCGKEAHMKTAEEVVKEDLLEYSGTNAGDNSKVLGLIQSLPGGETMTSLDLSSSSIRVKYGYNDTYDNEEYIQYWFNEQHTVEKNITFNIIYLACLVPNAQSIHLEIEEDGAYEISREQLESELASRNIYLPAADVLFNETAAEKFLMENMNKLEAVAYSRSFQERLLYR
ncbi:DUF4825 domain-containing protein [Alkalicoccus daliensis]|uniref:DUF4825 domain-containing protein n=1 Tax=Alkalicoccus daliensis TaxID=745820 RepID=A0A1G9ZCX0_9BACI|nr:DUF4825 domain-containing protein [Alkalicoccus daliensis]SDN18947.1 protein of unknown function [Alkalicoccus daliensis]